MTDMLQSTLATALTISLILGGVGALGLVVKSLYDFSRTGPRIRDEIRQRYRRYSIWALSRLGLWAALIIVWISLISMLPYLSYSISHNHHGSIGNLLISGIIGFIYITLLQFLHHLYIYPSSIMMSSNYKMSRFYWIWSKLSVSRLRWLRLSLLVVIILPVAYSLSRLGDNNEWENFFSIFFVSAVLFLPYIVNSWPTATRPKKGSIEAMGLPNILMIGCDTLRADRISATGYHRPTTPFLDALTRKGTLFTNCYTPSARTAPSLASLLTGSWPQSHGIRSNFTTEDLDLNKTSLSQILADKGYETVAISDWAGSDLGKFSFNIHHLDLPEDQWNLKYLIRQGPKDIRLFLTLFTHNRFGKRFLPELYYLAGIPLTSDLGKQTRRWVSRLATGGKPFFINTFMATTHPPFGSEYPYYTIYSDPDYVGESKFAMSRLSDPFDIIKSQKEPREAFDLDQIIDLYDGAVRCFDDEVRAIYHHLCSCGLDKNTIVIIYSDHGMELFEHDTWGQGNSAVGEASPRVPLIIIDPRRQGAGITREVVRTIDLAPTLLDLCNIDRPPSMEGESLSAYIDQNRIDHDLIAYFETGEWLATPPGQHDDHITYPEIFELLEVPDYSDGTLSIKKEYLYQINQARDRMIRKGKWKLVRFSLVNAAEYQLFDLERDPACKHNVAATHQKITDELSTELEEWIRRERELTDTNTES